MINGEKVIDKQRIVESCNDHFVSVGEKLARQTPVSKFSPERYMNMDIRNKFKVRPITPTNVFDIISKLNNGKATGAHNMSNKILKISNGVISPSLATILVSVHVLELIFSQMISRLAASGTYL